MTTDEWIENKESRVKVLEQTLQENEKVYIGTMEEVKNAMENGMIKNGMLIAVTKLK